MIIDYKNRTIVLSESLSDDGQTKVSVKYDILDNVFFFQDRNGNLKTLAGDTYEPTPVPNGNSITILPIMDGGLAGFQLVFQNEVADFMLDTWIINDISVNEWADSVNVADNKTVNILKSGIEPGIYALSTTSMNIVGDVSKITPTYEVTPEEEVVVLGLDYTEVAENFTPWFYEGSDIFTLLTPSQLTEYGLNEGDVIDSVLYNSLQNLSSSSIRVNLTNSQLTTLDAADSGDYIAALSEGPLTTINVTDYSNWYSVELSYKLTWDGESSILIRTKMTDIPGGIATSKVITSNVDNQEIYQDGSWANSGAGMMTWIGFILE